MDHGRAAHAPLQWGVAQDRTGVMLEIDWEGAKNQITKYELLLFEEWR